MAIGNQESKGLESQSPQTAMDIVAMTKDLWALKDRKTLLERVELSPWGTLDLEVLQKMEADLRNKRRSKNQTPAVEMGHILNWKSKLHRLSNPPQDNVSAS